MESRSASLFLIFVLPMLIVAASGRRSLLSSWVPISDVNDAHIQEIGKFAVTQYNTQSKAGLVFKSVVSGEEQVVAGMNYRLVVEANKGGSNAKYEAVVWEKQWEKFIQLTSFKPVA